VSLLPQNGCTPGEGINNCCNCRVPDQAASILSVPIVKNTQETLSTSDFSSTRIKVKIVRTHFSLIWYLLSRQNVFYFSWEINDLNDTKFKCIKNDLFPHYFWLYKYVLSSIFYVISEH
jgi:hypothetical protein